MRCGGMGGVLHLALAPFQEKCSCLYLSPLYRRVGRTSQKFYEERKPESVCQVILWLWTRVNRTVAPRVHYSQVPCHYLEKCIRSLTPAARSIRISLGFPVSAARCAADIPRAVTASRFAPIETKKIAKSRLPAWEAIKRGV